MIFNSASQFAQFAEGLANELNTKFTHETILKIAAQVYSAGLVAEAISELAEAGLSVVVHTCEGPEPTELG